MSAISLRGVSKRYRIYPRQRYRLVEALSLGSISRRRYFWSLKDINLEVEQGTTLGVLGRNGAGKSTLLQIVSGIVQPTSGSVRVEGQPVFLQLGAGFNPEFTGRENVMLNGLILGIDRRKMQERFDEIEAFADVGDFMDQPLKTYSSGMRARLGFAVAVNVEPEILLLDETFSVGDAVFKHMGVQKMCELRDRGTTILFVSHSMPLVKSFCTEAALLHEGRLMYRGNTSEAVDYYQALTSNTSTNRKSQTSFTVAPDRDVARDGADETDFSNSPALDNEGLRYGTQAAKIEKVILLDYRGEPVDVVAPESNLTIWVLVQYTRAVNNSVVGVVIRNEAGLDIFSTDTNLERSPIGQRQAGERVIVEFTFRVPLKHGSYSVVAAVSRSARRASYLDWIGVAAVFKVSRPSGRGAFASLVHLPTQVKVFGASERT